ncbi:hypothetical protein CYA_1527 [Synechococcus sp. JA-3-3Ab]|nr:hypothetical protein CYA_1527 [Synechococcus sp. JA-3-3Ab]
MEALPLILDDCSLGLSALTSRPLKAETLSGFFLKF